MEEEMGEEGIGIIGEMEEAEIGSSNNVSFHPSFTHLICTLLIELNLHSGFDQNDSDRRSSCALPTFLHSLSFTSLRYPQFSFLQSLFSPLLLS